MNKFENSFISTQLNNLYKGNEYYNDLYKFIFEYSDISNPYEEFDITMPYGFTQEEIGSGPLNLQFLEFLILLYKPSKILEIGTFAGISTLKIAKAISKYDTNALITTVEKYDKFAKIAKMNFQKNKLDKFINLINDDASNFIRNNSDKYDLIFIDGHKEAYKEYFEILQHRINRKGLIIIDDILFNGDVLNNKTISEKGKGVFLLLQSIKQNKNFHKMIFPIGNGVLCLIKV